MSSFLPDILAVLGLAFLGCGLFLLFGLGWCCLGTGSLLLFGGYLYGARTIDGSTNEVVG